MLIIGSKDESLYRVIKNSLLAGHMTFTFKICSWAAQDALEGRSLVTTDLTERQTECSEKLINITMEGI